MNRPRLFLALLLLALLAPAAHANGLPVGAWLGTPGGLLLPTQAPAVSVRSEELLFIISGEEAVVSANYHLENQGAATAGEVAFAVPSGASGIMLSVNGKSIPVPMNLGPGEMHGVEGADALTVRPTEWLSPLTSKPYSPRLWRQEPGVYWQSFQIALAPGPQELTVTYRSAGGKENATLIEPVWRYDYLLQPASRWAAFGDLTIRVQSLAPISLASNLPLTKLDEHRWEAHFSSLPTENLALFVGPPGSGALAQLWWSQSGRLWLMLGSAILLGLAAGLIRRAPWWLRLPFALLPLLLLDRGIFEPNPIGNVLHMANYGFVPLLYLLCWWLGARVSRRRGVRQRG